MRGSSSSSSVTVQPLLSPSPLDCSKPETASIGLPKSSSTCSRARPTSCGGDSRLPLSDMEPLQEVALQLFVGLLVDLAALEGGLGVRQLRPDPRRVVD